MRFEFKLETCEFVMSNQKLNLKLIADRVRLARVAKGLSQADVSERGGPSRPTLSKIERGIHIESIEAQVQRIAAVLEADPDYLLGHGGGDVVLLATGGGKSPVLDADLLADCILLVQNASTTKGINLPPERLAKLSVEVYQIALRKRAGEVVEGGNILEFLLA